MQIIQIVQISGNCPVEAEGLVLDRPFTFRARGSIWSFEVGGATPHGDPEWSIIRRYSDPATHPYAAGWMTEAEVRSFVELAAAEYLQWLGTRSVFMVTVPPDAGCELVELCHQKGWRVVT